MTVLTTWVGVTFSPDGTHVYITDTGMQKVLFGTNMSNPATMYQPSLIDSLCCQPLRHRTLC